MVRRFIFRKYWCVFDGEHFVGTIEASSKVLADVKAKIINHNFCVHGEPQGYNEMVDDGREDSSIVGGGFVKVSLLDKE